MALDILDWRAQACCEDGPLSEKDHTVRESILDLIESLYSTPESFNLAIYFYNHEESASLRSEALIAISSLGACCMDRLNKKLLDISKNDPSEIIQHISESYQKGAFE